MHSHVTAPFWHCLRPVLMLLLAVLAGCTSVPALSPPAASGRQFAASQWLLLKTPQRQAEAICMVELTGDALYLVATTPQGQTLLKATLKNDGTLTSELSPLMAQSGLKGDAIVRDLQIALWPAEALRNGGWQLQETADGQQRNVALNGSHWATITYTGDPKQPQQILIERGNGLYSVELRTLEWTSP